MPCACCAAARGPRRRETDGSILKKSGGRCWSRTSEGVSRQIYSLHPLATWITYHVRAQIKPDCRSLVNPRANAFSFSFSQSNKLFEDEDDHDAGIVAKAARSL